MPYLRNSAVFALGVATAVLFPTLAYGILGALTPVGNAATSSILTVCAALILIPSFLAFIGFLVGARLSQHHGQRAFALGVVSGIGALALFIPVFVMVGTGTDKLVFLVIVFLAFGFAASYAGSNQA